MLGVQRSLQINVRFRRARRQTSPCVVRVRRQSKTWRGMRASRRRCATNDVSVRDAWAEFTNSQDIMTIRS